MSWAETKSAINSTVGTGNFKPLDKIVEDLISKAANTQAITINKNGYYLPSENSIGFSSVEVSVPLPTGFTAIATGTFTLPDDASTYDIEHGLGIAPNFFIVAADTYSVSTSYSGYIYLQSGRIFGDHTPFRVLTWANNTITNSAVALGGTFSTESTITVPSDSSAKFKSGMRYRWICGVIENE